MAAPTAALLTGPIVFLAAPPISFGPTLTTLFSAYNQSLVNGSTLVLQAALAGLVIQGAYLVGLNKPVGRLPGGALCPQPEGQLLAAYLPRPGWR